MKTLEFYTSRELEIAQVKQAIAKTDANICRVQTDLALMRQKQLARHKELTRQETLAHIAHAEL